MQDDETTAKELVTSLRGAGVSISASTALKGRHLLGWISRGTAYCQLVHTQNQEKRFLWAQEYLGANFNDVIWTDETSVQMETHQRFCCRKNGQNPRYNPALNTQLRYLCGLASAGTEQRRPAFLRVSWMQSCIVKYWMSTWYHLFKLCIHIITASCRTMIQNIHHDEHKHSLPIRVSTGGAHHLSRQTQTLLRICGTS